MNTLPPIRTQETLLAEQTEALRNGSERDRLLVYLSAFSSSSQSLPVSDDHVKIARDAISDFRRNDYGEAESAVDSLAQLVDHYKDLAESFLEALANAGAVVDEHGDVRQEPFVLVNSAGEHLLGRPEIVGTFTYEDFDDLWDDYVRDYLPLATETERAWIATTFPTQIAALEEQGA